MLLIIGVNENNLVYLLLLTTISIVGVADDFYDLSQIIRFIVQILISLFFAIYFITTNPIEVFFIVLSIVYVINSLNFFDGIDLLVSTQIMFMLSSLLLIVAYQNIVLPENLVNINYIMTLSVISLIGFSIYNYSPASLFLGSSGSYYLGFLISTLFAFLIFTENISLYTCMILYSTPLIDTILVFIFRFTTKLRHQYKKSSNLISSLIESIKTVFFVAHSIHNYQIMSRKLKSHIKVDIFILTLNIVWCLPLALLSIIYTDSSHLIFILSLIPYTIISIYNKTGIEVYK
jgi:UDP-N-acetylmuramyl pentapeptide phosphotransferase/UDP-N-acetylglucosamine-1-phosphate transferase